MRAGVRQQQWNLVSAFACQVLPMALSTLKDESKMRSYSGYGLRFKTQTKVLRMEQKKGFMDEPLGAVEML